MDRKHRQLFANIAATSADERKQRDQHRSVHHNISNMLKRSNMRTTVDDFQETPPAAASSVASFSSMKSDEKSNRYVLKIDIVSQQEVVVQSAKAGQQVEQCRRRESIKKGHISVMSINQECNNNNNSRVMMVPIDGNLSDDQKLVLNISADGTSSISARAKNINRIMLSDSFSNSDDHLDSGTCSDADINVFHSPTSESPQPPPLPPKLNGKSSSQRQKDQQMLSDSFYSDASSASSSDSMQYNGSLTIHHNGSTVVANNHHLVSPDLIRSIEDHHHSNSTTKNSCRDVIGSDGSEPNGSPLPISLLMDIRRNRTLKFNDEDGDDEETTSDENEDHELIMCNRAMSDGEEKLVIFSDDKSYKFHINEHLSNNLKDCNIMTHEESDENFAGYKDIHSRTATIRSAKGTIRGVKNRVRNGIKTFLLNSSTTVRVSSNQVFFCFLRVRSVCI